MDGRRSSHFALSLVLGLVAANLCGCSLFQTKPAYEVKRPAPKVDFEEAEAPPSMNPFADSPKQEGTITGLALAKLKFSNARSAKEQPEKQFRGYEEARQIYQAILERDPKNIEAARGLSACYVAMRDFDRASATLLKAIEVHPKLGILWADLAVISSKQNDFRTAIVRLNKALEMDPQNQEVMKMLGVNLIFAGQPDRGIEMLARAGGRATAHYQAARIFDRTGQPELARRHVMLALDANPNFSDAKAMLAEFEGSRPASRPSLAAPTSLPAPGEVGLQLSADR